ncbi:MAG: hypothetical protein ACRD1O_00800 [Terriglobia bacterium]
MNKLILIVAIALLGLPVIAVAATFKNAPIVDVMCSTQAAANPDAHTKMCALQCKEGGYGIYTKEGKFLKFDSQGNAKALAAIKSSTKTAHLRVDVTGQVTGGILKVESLKLD